MARFIPNAEIHRLPAARVQVGYGREACTPTGADAHEIRTRRQHANGPLARPRNATNPARPRRRGDRVTAKWRSRHVQGHGRTRIVGTYRCERK